MSTLALAGTFVLLLSDPREAAHAAALARALEAGGALVERVDVEAHLARARPGKCAYLAGDLESLAQGAQKRRGLPAYVRPVAVGLGLGLPAAEGAVAQAPDGTFAGAVLVGPRPSRGLPAVLCRGRLTGKTRVLPVPDDASAVEAVASFGVPKAPELPSGPSAVADLPLVEVPSKVSGTRFAVLLTGDGGWAGLDQGLSAALADAGVPVVGLDSLRFFWKRRTPEETAEAVGRVVRHYRAAWGRDEVLLIGYSRGADLVPFLPPRLPEDVRRSVRLVAMLGLATFAEFEVHAVDVLFAWKRDAAMSTARAVEALGDLPVLCVEGSDEHDSGCPAIAARPNVKRWVLPGGHHFDRDYARLARLVLSAAPEPAAER